MTGTDAPSLVVIETQPENWMTVRSSAKILEEVSGDENTHTHMHTRAHARRLQAKKYYCEVHHSEIQSYRRRHKCLGLKFKEWNFAPPLSALPSEPTPYARVHVTAWQAMMCGSGEFTELPTNPPSRPNCSMLTGLHIWHVKKEPQNRNGYEDLYTT